MMEHAATPPLRAPRRSMTPESKPNPGAVIRALRAETRWSGERMAEQMGLHATTISRHESGSMVPRNDVLEKYERIFSKKLKRKVVIGRNAK